MVLGQRSLTREYESEGFRKRKKNLKKGVHPWSRLTKDYKERFLSAQYKKKRANVKEDGLKKSGLKREVVFAQGLIDVTYLHMSLSRNLLSP